MLSKNLNNWLTTLNLREIEWGLTRNQALSQLNKLSEVKQKLIYTNWVAEYDIQFSSTNKTLSTYYYRKLHDVRLTFEWHRFFTFWQRVKFHKSQYLLLYTDIFEDYPIIRYLGKKTNEAYSVGWYSGLNSNKRGLLRFKNSYLAGKVDIVLRPSIIITFSAFYPVTMQFLKEFGSYNIYHVAFTSFGDKFITGAYPVWMTKNYINFYYYYYLFYRVFHKVIEPLGLSNKILSQDCFARKFKTNILVKRNKFIKWKKRLRLKFWKRQTKLVWYRGKELKRHKKIRFWNSYYSWVRLRSCKVYKKSILLKVLRQRRVSKKLK